MTTRRQRLLAQALSWAQCSPEQFAKQHESYAAYYSGRQLRRFLKGQEMPDHLADMLRAFLNSRMAS